MSLKIDDFLDRLNRKGTLNPVSEATRTAYRNTLEQFERFLDGEAVVVNIFSHRFISIHKDSAASHFLFFPL